MTDEIRDGDDLSWLRTLEERVEQASDRLRSLREENANLAARVAELEQASATAGEKEEAAWEQERSQVRERVEALVDGLEELLSSAE